MKSRIIILFLFIVCTSCVAQTSYFDLLNTGNAKVYSGDYDVAFSYYNKAFANSNPFFFDLINYSILASKCHKIEKFNWSIKKLIVQKGIDSTYLFKYIDRNYFCESSLQLFRDKYNSYLNEIEIDTNYNSFLKELLDRDQKIRNKLKTSHSTLNNLELKKIDSLNSVLFLDKISKLGLPSENKCGYLIAGTETTLWDMVQTLLIHLIKSKQYDTILYILDKASDKEMFHPQIISNLYQYLWNADEFRNKDEFLFYSSYLTFVGKHLCRPFIDLDPKRIEIINRNRAQIGIDSLHNSSKYYLCQTIFKVKDPNYVDFHLTPYVINEAIPEIVFRKNKEIINKYKINMESLAELCNCK